MHRPRVAFVVQRYGRDVAGGAESYCRIIAERMSRYWDIEVVTTTAIDYMTWENYFPSGNEILNDILIHRFDVDTPRDVQKFNAYSRQILDEDYCMTIDDAKRWMELQGPISTTMSKFLVSNHSNYKAVFFFTYLYATTYINLPLVSTKKILVPFAHHEAPLYMPIWDDFFLLPDAFVYSSLEEKILLESRFVKLHKASDIVGIGVDLPQDIQPERFRQQYSIYVPFILYIGRIDESKGCDELFHYFRYLKEDVHIPLKLVLIGKNVIEIPQHRDIIHLGFVDECSKYDAIAACKFLVNPSPFESLSMVLLEAWSLEKPTLVNAIAEVMVGQSQRSGGGLSYNNYETFKKNTFYLLNRSYRFKGMKQFVQESYSWKIIEEKFLRLFESVQK